MQVFTWIPRKYGARLGFVVSDGVVVAENITQKDARELFTFDGATFTYDRDGMNRQDASGVSLAYRIANNMVERKPFVR